MRRRMSALLTAVVGLSSLEAAQPRSKAVPPPQPNPEALAASQSYRIALAQVIQKRGLDQYYLQGAGGPWAAGIPLPATTTPAAASTTAGRAKATDKPEVAGSVNPANRSGATPALAAAKKQRDGEGKVRLWDRLFRRRSSERTTATSSVTTPDLSPKTAFADLPAEGTVR